MRQWLLKFGGTRRVGRWATASSSSSQEQSGEGTTDDKLESLPACLDAVEEEAGVEEEDAVDILAVGRTSVAALVVLAICRVFRRVEEHFNLLALIARVGGANSR